MNLSNKSSKDICNLNNKTVFLVIDKKEQIPGLESICRSLSEKSKISVGAYTHQLKEMLGEQGIRSTVFSDYISTRVNDEIDRLADGYSDNWYRTDKGDKTIYKGISYGEVLKLSVAFHFMNLMKEIEGILSAISETKANAIIFLNDKPLFREMAKSLKKEECLVLFLVSALRIMSFLRYFLKIILYKTIVFYAKPLSDLIQRKRIAQKTNNYPHPSAQKKIVLFYYKGTRILEPVRKLLYKTNPQDIDVLTIGDKNLDKSIKKLFDEELPLRTFDYFLSINLKQIYHAVKFIAGFWKNSGKLQPVNYRGLDLLKASDELESIWKVHAFRLISDRSAIETYLAKYKPRLVIPYIEVWPLARLLVKVCSSRNIKTLMVQHGVTSDKPYYKVTWTPSIVDKLAVWGEGSKEYFIKNGVNENKMEITGCTLFDKLFIEKDSILKEEVYSRYGIPESKKVILYATQNFPDGVKRGLFYNIVNSIHKLNDVFLVVKLHPAPRETVELYNQLLAKTNFDKGNILILKDDSLYPLLKISDVLVTVHSTVHVEAILFDKNVVILHFSESPDLAAVKYGAALCSYSENETEDVIKRALYDRETQERLKSNRDKFINGYTYKFDGQATRRITELIHSMLNLSC